MTASIESRTTYTAGSRPSFENAKTQDAVLRSLQTLAESARRVSPLFIGAHPEIPWKSIAGFRNVLVHDYLGVDLQQVWNVVEKDLPRLREALKQALGNP